MSGPTIAFINESSVVHPDEFAEVVQALQIQVTRDVAPVWDVDATIMAAGPGNLPPSGAWMVAILDDSDQAGCFTGDTKISLLDGTERTFAELATDFAGKTFWVYSYDVGISRVVPGLAHSSRVTRKGAALVRVVLDNGEQIRCTPDHLFLTRAGRYKRADHLAAGESLRPLYRSVTTSGSLIGYEMVHPGNRDRRAFTHRIAANLAPATVCSVCGTSLPDEAHCVRHHANFNKRDNRPENFDWLTNDEHLVVHQRHAHEVMRRLWADPAFRAMQAAVASKVGKRTGPINILRYNKSDAHRERASENLKLLWRDNREAMLLVCEAAGRAVGGANLAAWNASDEGRLHSLAMAAAHLAPYAQSEENRAKMRELGPLRLTAWNTSDAGRAASVANATAKHRSGVLVPKKYAHNRWHLARGIVNPNCEFCTETNHKVAAVELLTETEDVYDITVEEHHNFALTSGVFVHNSLGYHDLTAAGMPLAKVFAKSDLDDGQHWSVTASHELVECLVDPWINLAVISPDGKMLYVREACDACENESYAYTIAGVLVSDFVTPEWFGSGGAGARYDIQGHITSPFEILPGGYIGCQQMWSQGGWQVITANSDGSHRNSGPAYSEKSRWQKRMASRSMWRLSHPPRG